MKRHRHPDHCLTHSIHRYQKNPQTPQSTAVRLQRQDHLMPRRLAKSVYWRSNAIENEDDIGDAHSLSTAHLRHGRDLPQELNIQLASRFLYTAIWKLTRSRRSLMASRMSE